MKIEIRHDFKPGWGMIGWTADLFIDDLRISTGVGMDREHAIQRLAQKIDQRVLLRAKEQPYDHLLPAHEKALAKWIEAEEKRRQK